MIRVIHIVIIGLGLIGLMLTAAIPQQMNFQGMLTDSEGEPLNEIVALTFTLNDSEASGNLLWSEMHPTVLVTDGLFSVMLGSVGDPIPDSAFAGANCWFGVSIDGGSELTPRSQIVSTGYTFRVASIDGATGGTISGDVFIQSNLDVDGDLLITGKMGVGTPSPAAKLHIGGTPGIDGLMFPISTSSGAHLTQGGAWTNSSDRNLKENFTAVDGDELLDKISSLPIARWNYKVEGDEVTHIGPTAQDFSELFEVGTDDKSISTIDPAGIALAAIKELTTRNNELTEMVMKLKERLDQFENSNDSKKTSTNER